MRIQHPTAERDAPTTPLVACPDGQHRAVGEDGMVSIDDADVAAELADVWGEQYGVDPEELLVDDDDGDDADAPPFDPSNHTIAELQNELGDVDDGDDLLMIEEAETNGRGRKGALQAIHSRMDDLDEQDADE